MLEEKAGLSQDKPAAIVLCGPDGPTPEQAEELQRAEAEGRRTLAILLVPGVGPHHPGETGQRCTVAQGHAQP